MVTVLPAMGPTIAPGPRWGCRPCSHSEVPQPHRRGRITSRRDGNLYAPVERMKRPPPSTYQSLHVDSFPPHPLPTIRACICPSGLPLNETVPNQHAIYCLSPPFLDRTYYFGLADKTLLFYVSKMDKIKEVSLHCNAPCSAG